MKRNNSYIYPKTIREVIDGKRHYDINDSKLPSVTTILSAQARQTSLLCIKMKWQ